LQRRPVVDRRIGLGEQQDHVRLSQAQLAPASGLGIAHVHDKFIGALDRVKPFSRALCPTMIPHQFSSADVIEECHELGGEHGRAVAAVVRNDCEGPRHRALRASLCL
jgi:hypothetical protein